MDRFGYTEIKLCFNFIGMLPISFRTFKKIALSRYRNLNWSQMEPVHLDRTFKCVPTVKFITEHWDGSYIKERSQAIGSQKLWVSQDMGVPSYGTIKRQELKKGIEFRSYID